VRQGLYLVAVRRFGDLTPGPWLRQEPPPLRERRGGTALSPAKGRGVRSAAGVRARPRTTRQRTLPARSAPLDGAPPTWYTDSLMDETPEQSRGPSLAEAASLRSTRDLTTGSIPRHLLAFSLPMLAGTALQAAYSFVNALWVGNKLGKDAMAAITVSFPVLFVLLAIAGGLTMGANVLVAQHFGAKDHEGVRRVVRNSNALVLMVGLVFVIAGHNAAERILVLMNTPPEVLGLATGYLRIFLWSMPSMFAVFLIASQLRGTGDAKTPLYFQIVGVTVTAILDPILMFGWFGAPALGLNGTAVAAVITQAGATVALAWYVVARRHIIAPDIRNMRPDRETTALILKIGVPSMLQQALASLGIAFMTGIVNRFGADAAAAFGAAGRIDQLAFMPAMTIGAAVSTLSGQNIGARHFHRVREIFRWALFMGCGITLLATVTALIAPEHAIRLFVKDANVIAIGAGYLRIMGPGYILFAVMFVGNGIANGAGHTFISTLTTLVGLWFVRVPLAQYLTTVTGRVDGVWWAMLAGFVAGVAISVGYYYSGLWRKPIGRRDTMPVPAQLAAEVACEVGAE